MKIKFQISNFKFQIIKVVLVLILAFSLLTSHFSLSPAFAGHCESGNPPGSQYCNPSTNTMWIDNPDCTHTEVTPVVSCSRSIEGVFGQIKAPKPIAGLGFGATGIGNFLSKVVLLIFTVASLIFLFMIIFSALQWLTSGGDKEKVDKAKSRLTNAIIGIVLLSFAFLIAEVLGNITGFRFF